MKTIRTILQSKILYLAFSLLLVFGCNEKETKTQEEPEPTKAPAQIISEEQAAILFNTYSTNRVPSIEEFENAGSEEGEEAHVAARYTYFDFNVMKEYMKYIEEQAASAGKDIRTLRIYYATYPARSPKDPNKNTVFLVPTTDFDNVNKAFKISLVDNKPVAEAIPWNFHRGGQKAMGQDQMENEKNQAGFFSLNATNTFLFNGGSLILNDGSTAPPPPNQ